MPFELQEVTRVEITKVNVRTELHGEERVLAIDLRCRLKGENLILDLIKPGLREHFYFNKALTAGQEALPGVVIPMPNLKHPELPTEGIAFEHGPKGRSRGYRLIRDFGIDDAAWDFTDVVLASMLIKEVMEGGSATIEWTLQYNGDELQDQKTLNEMVRLGVVGELHMKLLAPPELMQVKKGYRAGRADTPQPGPDDGQQQLAGDAGEDQDEDDEHQDETPEEALARAEQEATSGAAAT